jgi:hypothetical protein
MTAGSRLSTRGIIAAEEVLHMVMLYVGGKKVEWAEAEKALASTEAGQLELRNDAGEVLGVVVRKIATFEDDPDWVKAITPEEIERRMAEPGYTFEEMKKRLGWE